jgi:hypothetical protein
MTFRSEQWYGTNPKIEMSLLTSLPVDILRYILEEFLSFSTLAALRRVSTMMRTHASNANTLLRSKFHMQVREMCCMIRETPSKYSTATRVRYEAMIRRLLSGRVVGIIIDDKDPFRCLETLLLTPQLRCVDNFSIGLSAIKYAVSLCKRRPTA